ncbi:hypothetical protein RJ495_000072 [Pluralibacter gergoviae]|nr:hypothetical protein [Pluralibacter gergoviae]KMK32977.1 hypothetical protein ABW12_10150 [Pluralibacter gergoviae]
MFVHRHAFQQATSDHVFQRAPGRLQLAALMEGLHTVKQVGNPGGIIVAMSKSLLKNVKDMQSS